MTRRTRVLVCEDSPTYAAALRRTLEHAGDIDVVGVHQSAESALAALRACEPDVVTMDLALPGLGGIEAVEEIMSARPTPIVVLSGLVGNGTAAAAALAAGALDAVAKEDLDLRNPAGREAEAFRRRVKMLAGVRVIRHPRARLRRYEPQAVQLVGGTHVAICASTGGPQALVRVLGALPEGYPLPVLVVQHMTEGFTEGLVRWLRRTLPMPVALASDRVRAESGVWVAPEGAHLVLRGDGRLGLDDVTPGTPHKPSGDVLFRSLARHAGAGAVAVVLSGMGVDGAAGVAEVKAAGGSTVAQDEGTSAIYGMPRAAAEHGARHVLPVEEIGPALASLARVRA